MVISVSARVDDIEYDLQHEAEDVDNQSMIDLCTDDSCSKQWIKNEKNDKLY